MASKLDFSEGTLTNRLAEDVLTNFSFVRLKLDVEVVHFSDLLDLVIVTDRFINFSLFSFTFI